MFKKCLSLLLTLTVALSAIAVLAIPAAAASRYDPVTLSGVLRDNMSDHNYTNNVFQEPVYSNLFENDDGTLTRVEAFENSRNIENSAILIETYSADGKTLISTKTLEFEYPVFGGFYAGQNYNYFVFGQNNGQKDDYSVVLCFVKYSKNWERLSAVCDCGANTVNPIYSGSLRMTECGGKLYVHTSHRMYNLHQANMTYVINTGSMTIAESYYNVDFSPYGYCSHSFNQFITNDGKYIFTVDHGDAYPRAIVLTRKLAAENYSRNCYSTSLIGLSRTGNTGNNWTGATVGGLEAAGKNCLVTGSVVDYENFVASTVMSYSIYYTYNIFVAVADKENLSDKSVKMLTHYTKADKIKVSNPHLVKLNDDKLLIVWEEKNDETDSAYTRFATINSSGELTSPVYSNDYLLSDCQPILCRDGLVRWYVGSSYSEKLYTLDPADLQTCANAKAQPVDVKSVSLNQTEATMDVNSTLQLTAALSPDNVYDDTVTWSSSNETVASVDSSGKVTAKSKGTARIYAKSANGKYEDCWVTVILPVKEVSLNKSSVELEPDQSTVLTATITPSDSSYQKVTWETSDPNVLELTSFNDDNNTSKFTAKGVGKATVTATANGKTATCQVTVRNTTIKLDRSSLSLNIGDKSRLKATVTPSDSPIKEVKWYSSNTSIASVDDGGNVTALKEGTATVTASLSNGNKASCQLTVIDPTVPVTAIKLDTTSMTLDIGKTQSLVATVSPANATDKSVTWSSTNTAVATVDANGKVTAKSKGTAIIYARSVNGRTENCMVKVVIPVSSISLDIKSADLEIDKSVMLTATVAPSDAANQTVTWDFSDPDVIELTYCYYNNMLKITAKGVGKATVTASTANGKKAICQVTVRNTQVKLDRSALSLNIGEQHKLNAAVTPSDSPIKEISWYSSNTSVASVDSNGNVTARRAGSAKITASLSNGSKASCQLTVIDPTIPVSSVTLSDAAVTLERGEERRISATVSPDNATDKAVTWDSSDTDIVWVNASGTITAAGVGTATVTATAANGKKAACQVTVLHTTITLDKSSLNLLIGRKYRLNAAVSPSNSPTDAVSWHSSNASVASVDSVGNVTARKEGTATVTASLPNGSKATCQLTVLCATPIISKIENTASGVKMTWGKVAGAEKYRVYVRKANTAKWTKLGDTAGNVYIHLAAKSGVKYAYTVRCISSDKKRFMSGYSTAGKSITFVATPKPPTLKNTKNGVQVSWKKIAGAQRYRIYRKIGKGKWAKLADTTSVKYVDKKAKKGVTYSYTIRCMTKNGKAFTSSYNPTGKSIKCKR